MQSKSCIVSVAFREMYTRHSTNQEAWIKEHHPELSCIYFRDVLPYKHGIHKDDIVTKFQQSLYGFKPHAIKQAVNAGYTKIVWLDPSVMPVDSLDILFDELESHPVIVRTGDQSLSSMVNKRALDWFGVGDISNINHVGGTIYGFNFDNIIAVNIFNKWLEAEEAGIFGTQDDFMMGHWADEACMALALAKYNHEQYFPSFKYLNQKDLEKTI